MDTTSNPLKTMNIKAPLWFYFVATLSLLWNIMGLMAFVMQMTMTPDALAQMSPDQIKLYETTPIWVDAVFGFAVVSGVLGCLLLLFRKLIAYKVLVASLIAILLQMTYVFCIQQAAVVLGADALIMPSVVVVWGLFLVWFSQLSTTKSWLV
ncbi:MAG: hypothetical protein WC024_13835 [Shewanella sp.]|uniref:hypothetical protein n=1 Tax=Shewanella TaxID=22 RepID=UPI000DE9BDCC|nr:MULTISPECIES: hypothetical protein [unclassified Shewanella]RBP80347.1 hypothetical protein DET47_105174 [Shewanella putrefaciens]MCU8011677.1 hypothetical protein [Shewanella sp. SM74]MCU8033230.1 hypothetical protein [Shewanella sp. SM71]MCU8090448.1 hypothetical protein [Shewanella sp. SM20]MCU8097958.1 hypothetical protein [Shewanella sp. SM102]